jgi:hypothetical protein
LRDGFQQREAVGEHGARLQAAVVDDDGHVVVGVHADVARRAGADLLSGALDLNALHIGPA